jgi:hypothetical protein
MLLYVRRFSSSFRGLTEVVADKGLFCALDTYRGQAWRKTLQEERRIGHANTVEGSGSARRSRHPRRAPTSYAPRCASANIPTAALARTGSLPTTSQVVHGTPSLAGRAASDARPAVGLRIPLARSHNPRCHNQRSAATRTGQLDALATICERTPCAGADSLLGYASAEGSVLVVGSATAENFEVRASRFVPRRPCSLTLLVMIGRDAWAACSMSRDVDSVCRSC